MPPDETVAPWAQGEDWTRHRHIITELYLNQRKKLGEVRKIMTEKYNFRATLKMYKTRLKSWGVVKNIKRKQMLSERPHPNSTNESSKEAEVIKELTPWTDQRTVQNTIEAYTMKRQRLVTTDPLPTESLLQCMGPPDFYRHAEDVLRLSLEYVNSMGLQDPGSPSTMTKPIVASPAAADWFTSVTTARTLFSLGHYQQAFRIVDICCDRYKSMLVSPDMAALGLTLGAILAFLRSGNGLVDLFLNFAYKMSQILLGSYHPLVVLFYKLKKSGADNLAHCIAMVIQYRLGSRVHGVSPPMIDTYGDIYSDLVYHKVLNKGFMDCGLTNLQRVLDQQTQTQLESQYGNPRSTQALQIRIAWLHFHKGDYNKASKLVLEMMSNMIDAQVATGCYDLLHDIAVIERNDELALEMMEKAVATSVEAYGHTQCVTAGKMARLESYLRSTGRLLEADRIHTDLEMHLKQFSLKARFPNSLSLAIFEIPGNMERRT